MQLQCHLSSSRLHQMKKASKAPLIVKDNIDGAEGHNNFCNISYRSKDCFHTKLNFTFSIKIEDTVYKPN